LCAYDFDAFKENIIIEMAAQRTAIEMKLDVQTTKQEAMDEKLKLILNLMTCRNTWDFFYPFFFYFAHDFFFVTLINNINLY
jgi:hypothetical protein